MYIEQLPSGYWGLFLDNGRRLGVFRTRKEAERDRGRRMRKRRNS